MNIALVGDLSNNSPDRLDKVLTAAETGNPGLNPVVPPADWIIQLGDLSGAYDAVKAHYQTGKLMVVPGNHDVEFDKLGLPRNWRRELGGLMTVIGIDNSNDTITPEAWELMKEPMNTPFVMVAAHKSPVPIVLPDGTESTHIMGEGSVNADAQRLVDDLEVPVIDVMACGHYHGHTLQVTNFGFPLICEGRGGAAPNLAYSLMTVVQHGWVLHDVPVA